MKVKIRETELLSDNWYILKKYTLDYEKKDGTWDTQVREVYDRGNGAVILLYHRTKKTVILTRQFRLPTLLNDNPTGMLIEACAGLLEEEGAEEAIRRETEEETGYVIGSVEKVFQAYMSPGSVTEILHFYIGEYTAQMKVSEGGGLATEHEEIEVLELDFEVAYDMIATGEVRDAKTIMLLQYVKLHKARLLV